MHWIASANAVGLQFMLKISCCWIPIRFQMFNDMIGSIELMWLVSWWKHKFTRARNPRTNIIICSNLSQREIRSASRCWFGKVAGMNYTYVAQVRSLKIATAVVKKIGGSWNDITTRGPIDVRVRTLQHFIILSQLDEKLAASKFKTGVVLFSGEDKQFYWS